MSTQNRVLCYKSTLTGNALEPYEVDAILVEDPTNEEWSEFYNITKVVNIENE